MSEIPTVKVTVDSSDAISIESARTTLALRSKRLRFPGMQEQFGKCLAILFERINNPQDYIPEAVEDAKHDAMVLAGLPEIGASVPTSQPIEAAQPMIAWQCEKCGKYHGVYFPKDGCEWCKGDAIAERMGLTKHA